MKKFILLLVVMLAIVGCETKDVPADEGKDKTPVIVEKESDKTDQAQKTNEETIIIEKEVAKIKEELQFEQIASAIASDFEIMNEVEMFIGVNSTKDFVIDESLFDNNYAIAVGKAGRKVLVFDTTIDKGRVAIHVSIDENNEVTDAQPFYSGTYSQMISDLEAGKVDEYPLAAFFGDSFDHWAKK